MLFKYLISFYHRIDKASPRVFLMKIILTNYYRDENTEVYNKEVPRDVIRSNNIRRKSEVENIVKWR